MALKSLFDRVFGPLESIPNENVTPPTTVKRAAVDYRGSIGSCYDACKDDIRGKLGGKIITRQYRSKEEVRCDLFPGTTEHRQNLLEFVQIDRELRLSIILDLPDVVSGSGMGAVIKYPRLIDKHTRLLYIYQPISSEAYDAKLHKLCKSVKKYRHEAYATHIITEIVFGIHALIILQLPTDREKEIDNLLSKMHQNLCCTDYNALKLNPDEETSIGCIKSTTTYSNISDLTPDKNLKEIYQRIKEMQMCQKRPQPMIYTLTPIPWFYGEDASKIPTFYASKKDDVEGLEILLLSRSSELQAWQRCLDHDLPELLQGKLEQDLKQIKESFFELQALCMGDIERIGSILRTVREGSKTYSFLDTAISTGAMERIQKLSRVLNSRMEQLKGKGNFVKRLPGDGFEYCDMADFGIRENVPKEVLYNLLFGNDIKKAIFFTHDALRADNRGRWIELYSQMMRERENNPELRLVYADFTYSAYRPEKMEIMLSLDIQDKQDRLKAPVSSKEVPQTKPSLQIPSSDETINILLIGESGVGKSTFINAFANYLYFESLEQALKGKPVVIIPVSFVLTINDNFDERIINFGDIDANENHNNVGQSVTQRCKSYVFNISEKRKLRIIDTPGFGDTRGSDQDFLNMEEIFSFLKNVPYLNGICLLFKPDVLQLNPFLRSCFTQLFDYFGEVIRQYLIFCFTNARSTFFTPGNTRALLNAFFQSFPVKDIPFEKRNTFCFDSESFRYLVATQADVEFSDIERVELEQSWLRSVTESKRFRGYLCEQSSREKIGDCQSIQDAQRRVRSMARPMLEAWRYFLRNSLLYDKNFSIELSATPISTPSIHCDRKHESLLFGHIWIQLDHLHSLFSTCTADEHTVVEYRLEYKPCNQRSDTTIDDLRKMIRDLEVQCVELSLFLRGHSSTPQHDPFLKTMTQMVVEEEDIRRAHSPNELNTKLLQHLSKFKKEYEEELKAPISSGEGASLLKIYDTIKSVGDIPIVSIQLAAMKESQKTFLESNEHSALRSGKN